MKYGNLTLGQIEAIINKLGGHDMALRFLRDELSVSTPSRSWREEDGVIYFEVTSDGTTGEDWIKRLEGNGFRVEDRAKQVLRSPRFMPTKGLTTEVAVLKDGLFEDSNRITKKIRAEADKRKLSKPNAEVSCLIRLKFTDKKIEAMGLWHIVTMHEPINDSGGDPRLLNADRRGDSSWLDAYYDRPDGRWHRGSGFAFAVSPAQKEYPMLHDEAIEAVAILLYETNCKFKGWPVQWNNEINQTKNVWREEARATIVAWVSRQRPLDPETRKILYDNRWKLYDDHTPSS